MLGSQGQLERVFLDLLVQAEHALAEATERRLIVATSTLAQRALVEIEYTSAAAKSPWDSLPRALKQSPQISRLDLTLCGPGSLLGSACALNGRRQSGFVKLDPQDWYGSRCFPGDSSKGIR